MSPLQSSSIYDLNSTLLSFQRGIEGHDKMQTIVERATLARSIRDGLRWQSHKFCRHLLGRRQVAKDRTSCMFLLNILSSSPLISFNSIINHPLSKDFKCIIIANIPLKQNCPFKEMLETKPISYVLLVLFPMWHISLMSAEAAYWLELN